jgi:F0F1-type ATP synthase membrane subunit c/vacuolar-type H+-ATPase subunit K
MISQGAAAAAAGYIVVIIPNALKEGVAENPGASLPKGLFNRMI